MYPFAELCREMTKIGKSETYHLIDILIRLILTLSMNDRFLANNLVIYIEKKF
jgi:hypothetical protein